MKKSLRLITALIIFTLSFPTPVFAEDLAITDNGTSAQNTVTTTETNHTDISQSNTAQVNNDVHVDSNSGHNSADQNTSGNTSIQTGSASSSTEVVNSANTSNVNANCCPNNQSENNATITGNGSNSTNTIDQNQTNQTTVTTTQNATISTTLNGTANTGNNQAVGNTGNVGIQTGGVRITSQIINTNINNSQVSVPNNYTSQTDTKITGNGANSLNNLYSQNNTTNLVTVLNNVSLNNILNTYGNSGNNDANYNTGDVFIKTGNVILDNLIKNYNINTSQVEISCLCSKIPTPPEIVKIPPTSGGGGPLPPTESSPPTGGGGGPGGSGGPGGPSLPNTGDNSLIYLTFIFLSLIALGLALTDDGLCAFIFHKSSIKLTTLLSGIILFVSLIKSSQPNWQLLKPQYHIYPI